MKVGMYKYLGFIVVLFFYIFPYIKINSNNLLNNNTSINTKYLRKPLVNIEHRTPIFLLKKDFGDNNDLNSNSEFSDTEKLIYPILGFLTIFIPIFVAFISMIVCAAIKFQPNEFDEVIREPIPEKTYNAYHRVKEATERIKRVRKVAAIARKNDEEDAEIFIKSQPFMPHKNKIKCFLENSQIVRRKQGSALRDNLNFASTNDFSSATVLNFDSRLNLINQRVENDSYNSLFTWMVETAHLMRDTKIFSKFYYDLSTTEIIEVATRSRVENSELARQWYKMVFENKSFVIEITNHNGTFGKLIGNISAIEFQTFTWIEDGKYDYTFCIDNFIEQDKIESFMIKHKIAFKNLIAAKFLEAFTSDYYTIAPLQKR